MSVERSIPPSDRSPAPADVHAVLVLDGAGCYGAEALAVPSPPAAAWLTPALLQ